MTQLLYNNKYTVMRRPTLVLALEKEQEAGAARQQIHFHRLVDCRESFGCDTRVYIGALKKETMMFHFRLDSVQQ